MNEQITSIIEQLKLNDGIIRDFDFANEPITDAEAKALADVLKNNYLLTSIKGFNHAWFAPSINAFLARNETFIECLCAINSYANKETQDPETPYRALQVIGALCTQHFLNAMLPFYLDSPELQNLIQKAKEQILHAKVDINYHTILIERMQKLGYRSNVQGICNGLAHMGMQAILLEDIQTFNQRVEHICTISTVEFNETMDRLKTHTDIGFFKCKIDKVDASIVDIHAFFDGIELYHQGHLYPELVAEGERLSNFQTSVLVKQWLVADLQAKNGGIVQLPIEFCDIFTQGSLTQYLNGLRNALDSSSSYTSPLAILLSSARHCISIGYNKSLSQWVFCDVEQLPIQTTNCDDELAAGILRAFSSNGIVTFDATFFAVKQNEEVIKQKIEDWNKQRALISPITSDKAMNWHDSHNATLLYVAAAHGHADKVSLLLDRGANPNLKHNNGKTSLYVVSQRGFTEVVELLLHAVPKYDLESEEVEFNSLHTAVAHHDKKTAELLLKNGANPNFKDPDDFTLLSVAVKYHSEMVELLLKYGADPNLLSKNLITPLFMAIAECQLESVELLLKYGATSEESYILLALEVYRERRRTDPGKRENALKICSMLEFALGAEQSDLGMKR